MELFPDSVIKRSIELYTATISSRSRVIYWIIIISLIISLLCLPFITVDISVQARGLFQSDIEKQTVNAPVHGRVLFAGIQRGDRVNAGDTILIMDTDGLQAQLRALKTLAHENYQSVKDLEFLVSGISKFSGLPEHVIQTRRYSSEQAIYRRKLEIQNHRYLHTRTEFIRDSVLFKQRVISVSEFESSRSRYHLEKQTTDQLKLDQLSRWNNDLTLRYAESRRLKAEIDIKNEEIGYRIVVSPVHGTIIHSDDIQAGSFIAAGQKITEISPESDIVAIFFVDPSDIGFMKMGQTVRMQVDAFNHHQWGMIEGKIAEISDDIIYDNVAAYFRIKCIPDHPFLSLKNGVTSEVTKGMTFTARVMVTRRTLFNLLFDKADKWFNPYTGINQ